jgi:NAD(P)H-dependent FMN reductase
MRLLTISGSLRAGGSNTVLLEAAALVAPPGIVVEADAGIGVLPHFNPDLDGEDGTLVPDVVRTLRARIGRADGVLVSTPEYAHGLPGAFKNALDWLVASLEFHGKPVAILSPTARSAYAQAQLREVLQTMNGRLVEAASVIVPLPRRDMTADEIAADAVLATALRAALAALADAVRAGP